MKPRSVAFTEYESSVFVFSNIQYPTLGGLGLSASTSYGVGVEFLQWRNINIQLTHRTRIKLTEIRHLFSWHLPS